MSPLPVQTGVHSTMQLTSQRVQDIMTPLANNQCNTHSYNHQQQQIIIIITVVTIVGHRGSMA